MEMIFHPTLDPSSPTGVYIPSDILACFSELNLMLEENDRDIFKNTEESDLWNYHFDLGVWLRNNWGLWSSASHLKQYFDGMRVSDADSMSNLILTSYWRYLNNMPIALQSQIVYIKVMQDQINKVDKKLH